MICYNMSLNRYKLLDGDKSTLLNSEGQVQNNVFLGTRDCIYLIHRKWTSYLLKLVLIYVAGNRNFYHPTTNSRMIQS